MLVFFFFFFFFFSFSLKGVLLLQNENFIECLNHFPTDLTSCSSEVDDQGTILKGSLTESIDKGHNYSVCVWPRPQCDLPEPHEGGVSKGFKRSQKNNNKSLVLLTFQLPCTNPVF